MTRRSRGGGPPARSVLCLAVLLAAGRLDASAFVPCDEADDPCVVDRATAVPPGARIDLGQRRLVITAGGALAAPGAAMTLRAREISIEAGGRIDVAGTVDLPGGTLSLAADRVDVRGALLAGGASGGRIDVVTSGEFRLSGTARIEGIGVEADAGNLTITAGTASVAGQVLASGGVRAFGGAVRIAASGPVALAGLVDVSGGEGGDVSVTAAGAAASIDLQRSGRLVASATGDGGSGGTIELLLRGAPAGELRVDGRIEANGANSSTLAGDGGLVFLESAGALRMDEALAVVSADGGSPDGFGGEITVSADGALHCSGRIAARGRGDSGLGGQIDLSAGDPTVLSCLLTVVGPDGGGDVQISSEASRFELTPSATIDASGSFAGDGGDITLQGSPTSRLTIDGALFADGGNGLTEEGGGDGGAIDIASGSVTSGGILRAAGGAASGSGGDVDVETLEDALIVSGRVDVAGLGLTAGGGRISLSSAAGVTVAGVLAAAGPARGGLVLAEASGALALPGQIDAAGPQGSVDLTSADEMSIAGSLEAGAEAGLFGCTVTLQADATMGAEEISVTGLESILVAGSVRTVSGTTLRYGPFGPPPQLAPTASVEGPLVTVLDEALPPCGACAPGDADGDGRVTDADRSTVVVELFDGDGEDADRVDGGAFPACSGADANGDGRLTAADTTGVALRTARRSIPAVR